jgi:Protein of unknown function (DUF3017)
MANRPANAGSDSAAPYGAYDWEPAGAGPPPPVHHQDLPRSLRAVPPHRPLQPPANPGPPVPPESAAHPRPAAATHAHARKAAVHNVSWLPYVVVLAGAGAGLFFAWQGSRYASLGTALVGGALLAAALARLLLPPRSAGLLTSRQKALDVATFAVFGAAVLALALMLP